MDYHISKRAGMEEALKKYISTVWKTDRGPLENIFRLLPYALVPFMGGIGSVVALVLSTLASHILGVSPADLGRKADQVLGLGPGDDPRHAGIMPKLEKFINNLVEAKTAQEDYCISKRASIWSMIKTGGYAGKIVVRGVLKAIAVLSSIFVFSHLGDLYEEIANPAREQVSEWAEPKRKTIIEPERKPKTVDDIADYIEQKYGLK